MFDVGPLCWLLHITTRLWILFYGSKYLHGILRDTESEARRKEIQKILAGPAMSDKDKGKFISLASANNAAPCARWLLFAVSSTCRPFNFAYRIRIVVEQFPNFAFRVDDLQVRCRTILAFQINYNKEGIGETLCWSWKGGERSMHKINIFRFDSSVNFAEILPPSFFFCLGCFFSFFGPNPTEHTSWQRRSVRRKEQKHAT